MTADEWLMDGTRLWWLSIAISIGLVVAFAAGRNRRARQARSTTFDGDGTRTPRATTWAAKPLEVQRWEDDGGALPVESMAAHRAGDLRR